MSDSRTSSADERLRQEFNQWAEQGKGEEMEAHHISITEQTLAVMKLKPGDRVLDLGCGAGWASRLMAQAVGNGDRPGQVVGLDVSDEMIRRARAASTDFDNLMFVVGSAVGRELLRQGAVGRVLLLLPGPGTRACGIVTRDGSERRGVHPHQFVP
jgi:SAM-dependent methyltransferase